MIHKIPQPKSIPVGGRRYEVMVCPKLLAEDDRHGVAEHILRHIRIASELSASCKEETFWHEVVEAINSVYLENNKIEHQQVSGIGQGVWQILQSLGIEIEWER